MITAVRPCWILFVTVVVSLCQPHSSLAENCLFEMIKFASDPFPPIYTKCVEGHCCSAEVRCAESSQARRLLDFCHLHEKHHKRSLSVQHDVCTNAQRSIKSSCRLHLASGLHVSHTPSSLSARRAPGVL